MAAVGVRKLRREDQDGGIDCCWMCWMCAQCNASRTAQQISSPFLHPLHPLHPYLAHRHAGMDNVATNYSVHQRHQLHQPYTLHTQPPYISPTSNVQLLHSPQITPKPVRGLFNSPACLSVTLKAVRAPLWIAMDRNVRMDPQKHWVQVVLRMISLLNRVNLVSHSSLHDHAISRMICESSLF